jgi:hypothetical protein
MPWSSFKNMNDGDLRAIYRYLRTLPPASGGPDPRQPESVKQNEGMGKAVAKL